MTTTRKHFASAIATAAVLLSTMSVRAEQADKYTKPHEPFTAPGMQVRMSLVNPIDHNWQKSVTPTVFQEIAPCRLSSTLTLDRYDMPWGGNAYLPNESRMYRSRGVLETVRFVDPCSEAIPNEAIGIVGRFTVTPGDGDGEIHIDSHQPAGPNATTVFKFKKGEVLMFEAGVLFGYDGTFGVQTWNAGADVTIDVLGYLLPDPAPAGAKGDKGDKGEQGIQGYMGEKGDRGNTGATGAKGDKGDPGVAGAKGDTGAAGPKGDTGAAGAKGDTGAKGDRGDIGATGAKGDKGDKGATGSKGDKGDIGATGAKGDKGEIGPAGAKGDKGDIGLTGANGARGEKGDKGDIGPAGANGARGEKGDKGEIGPTGANGARGEKGEKGDIGPAGSGATGAQGPKGEPGPKGDKGDPGVGLTATKGNACYPPGNNAQSQLRVNDPAVHVGSAIILNYTDAGSNGNALAIVSQGEGYFQTTGSPNECFQYVIFNITQ